MLIAAVTNTVRKNIFPLTKRRCLFSYVHKHSTIFEQTKQGSGIGVPFCRLFRYPKKCPQAKELTG